MAAKVLFVCVENSCRSQIAEGWARKLGRGVLEAHSAGSRPSGKVNPSAVALMAEVGVDLSGHKSQAITDFPSQGWDYVVTMGCGDACPFVPAKARLDWKIPDPKAMPREEFLAVIETLREKVQGLIDDIQGA